MRATSWRSLWPGWLNRASLTTGPSRHGSTGPMGDSPEIASLTFESMPRFGQRSHRQARSNHLKLESNCLNAVSLGIAARTSMRQRLGFHQCCIAATSRRARHHADSSPGGYAAPWRTHRTPDRHDDGPREFALRHGFGHKAPYTQRGVDLGILALQWLHRNPPRLRIGDEVCHPRAGSVGEQRQSLNQLNVLSNEWRMPAMALRTHEALDALQADPSDCASLRAVRAAQVAQERGAEGVRCWRWVTDAAAQAFAVRRQGDRPEAHGPQRRFNPQDHHPVSPGGRTGHSSEDRVRRPESAHGCGCNRHLQNNG